ncbi:MAG: hydroxymethylbilane synthase [Methyloceanibacter sp.]
MAKRPLLIGTRGSPLALWQARHVCALLLSPHGLADGDVELAIINTSGDRIKDRPLREFGGKGLFTKEIDEALLASKVDLAVHSMKDLPTDLPSKIIIGAVLPRGDVRDAFICGHAISLAELPEGAVVGTSSLRRQAQILRARPDLRVMDLRGNVETRLNKIEQGEADATVLALAGLERLGLASHAAAVLSTEEMLPAVAQGAIGVACRADDESTIALLSPLNDATTAACVTCERSFLTTLEGSCKTPIAGLAEIADGTMRFRGLVLKPDGSAWHGAESAAAAAAAESIGRDVGHELLARAGPQFLASIR